MAVTSTLVYTLVDEAGNPRTEGWFTIDFTGNYEGPDGGQSFDLSPYFRRIEQILTQPVSGTVLRALLSSATPASGAFWISGARVNVVPRIDDYSTPASTRFQIWADVPASGFGTREITSAPASVISGIRFVARVIGY